MTDSLSPILPEANEASLSFSSEDSGKPLEPVKQHVLKLCKIIAERQKTFAALQEIIEKLEARLNQGSSTSNRPPSSDSLQEKGKAPQSKEERDS